MMLAYYQHVETILPFFFLVRRDIAERGRDLKGVLAQYNKFVKPAFDDYILHVSPTQAYHRLVPISYNSRTISTF